MANQVTGIYRQWKSEIQSNTSLAVVFNTLKPNMMKVYIAIASKIELSTYNSS